MPLKRPAVWRRCDECHEWCNPDNGHWWLLTVGWPTGLYLVCWGCVGWFAHYGEETL